MREMSRSAAPRGRGRRRSGRAELIGGVYNSKAPSDVEGTYSAGQPSVAVAGGAKVADLA
jgi:hypothetical protein